MDPYNANYLTVGKEKAKNTKKFKKSKIFFPANFKQKETQMFIKGSVSLYYWYSSLRDSEFI